jgi:hypothetical protein
VCFCNAYDSGDHLHPKDAGYKAMGNSIDLSDVHEVSLTLSEKLPKKKPELIARLHPCPSRLGGFHTHLHKLKGRLLPRSRPIFHLL